MESVGVPVCVFDEEILCVLFADAVGVRVPASVRVSVILIFVVRETVRVAVGVLERGELRVMVGVAVPVLLGKIDRVNEEEPVDVLLSGPDFVDDRLTACVLEGLFVFVEQGVAVPVFDLAEEKDILAEPDVVFDPAREDEPVEEDEDVFDCVGELERVFVEVIVFEEVEDPVAVRVE